MQISLDVVTAIVDQEDDRGKSMVDHGGEFLDRELAEDRSEHNQHNNGWAYMLPSPMKRITRPSPLSRAARAAPRVLPMGS